MSDSDKTTSQFEDSQFEKTQLTYMPLKKKEDENNEENKESSSSHTPSSQSSTWYLISVLVLSLLGIIVSAYATHHHLEFKQHGQTSAVCNVNQTVSCDSIAASEYSELLNYPLGIWGLGYFLALFAIALILLPKKPLTFRSEAHYAALISLSLLGVITSLVLASLSFFVIKAVCLTCTMVYVLTLLLGGISIYYMKRHRFPLRLTGTYAPWPGFLSAAILLAITLASFGQLTSKPQESTTQPSTSTIQETEVSKPTKTFKVPNLADEDQAQDIPIAQSPYSQLGEDFRLGSDNAAVQLVEFADFQCAYCASFSSILKEVKEEFGDTVSIVFKNFPLDNSCNSTAGAVHPYACETAQLARCSGILLGKFWEFHDLAYIHQSRIKKEGAKQVAKEFGLSDAQIEECLKSKDILAKIKDDIALGQKLGVQGTPSVFINGRKLTLQSDLNLSAIIQMLLSNEAQKTSTPTTP
ncbi:MAG: thioredoxin domain-containing protein [Proteobacteria bacterium]|nr:thioredoxin domain-containing protein [Pseudomonadota bacterium]